MSHRVNQLKVIGMSVMEILNSSIDRSAVGGFPSPLLKRDVKSQATLNFLRQTTSVISKLTWAFTYIRSVSLRECDVIRTRIKPVFKKKK